MWFSCDQRHWSHFGLQYEPSLKTSFCHSAAGNMIWFVWWPLSHLQQQVTSDLGLQYFKHVSHNSTCFLAHPSKLVSVIFCKHHMILKASASPCNLFHIFAWTQHQLKDRLRTVGLQTDLWSSSKFMLVRRPWQVSTVGTPSKKAYPLSKSALTSF